MEKGKEIRKRKRKWKIRWRGVDETKGKRRDERKREEEKGKRKGEKGKRGRDRRGE